jgi:hypothetical protein
VGVINVPFPNVTEFGRAFDISVLVISSNTKSVQTVYQMALDDFFKTKAESFPNWEGLPEIRVNPGVDSLRRTQQVGWYAQVPKEFVIDPDQIEEDKLWQS